MKSLLFTLLLATGTAVGFANDKNNGKPADYVVHEWGTFTSLQGANGVQLSWLPQIGADLPPFVYRDNLRNSIGAGYLSRSVMSKASRRARQRMETPVLYFYSEKPRTVDVEVRFPNGSITEWYPRVSHAGPTMTSIAKERIPQGRAGESYIRWNDVQVLPHDQKVALKHDGKPSHYYPARETDANPLKISTGTGRWQVTETEKLLFYRGLGQFEAPLRVRLDLTETKMQLANAGKEALTDLFVLVVRHGQAKVTRIARVDGNKSVNTGWKPNAGLRPLKQVAQELAGNLEQVLVSRGLYRPEAKAMIKTWRQSWFEEDGVRVLYSLPNTWTDKTLPLELSPQPKEVVRVMIGRAELITPQVEWAVLREVVRYSEPARRAAAVAGVDKLQLGRFLDPVLAKLMGTHPTREFRLACDGLRQRYHEKYLKRRPLPLLTAANR